MSNILILLCCLGCCRDIIPATEKGIPCPTFTKVMVDKEVGNCTRSCKLYRICLQTIATVTLRIDGKALADRVSQKTCPAQVRRSFS